VLTGAHNPANLFAYNEVPTIAVAKDCWFRARRLFDAPFFLVMSLAVQTLVVFR
jgi:hypothetical protein